MVIGQARGIRATGWNGIYTSSHYLRPYDINETYLLFLRTSACTTKDPSPGSARPESTHAQIFSMTSPFQNPLIPSPPPYSSFSMLSSIVPTFLGASRIEIHHQSLQSPILSAASLGWLYHVTWQPCQRVISAGFQGRLPGAGQVYRTQDPGWYRHPSLWPLIKILNRMDVLLSWGSPHRTSLAADIDHDYSLTSYTKMHAFLLGCLEYETVTIPPWRGWSQRHGD
jgi:hypothetical protein